MEVDLTINRGFLRESRPEFFYFLLFTIFPRTEANADYPGAAALITALRHLFDDYAAAHGAKNTPLGDEIYQDILTATVTLIKYVENNCGNNFSQNNPVSIMQIDFLSIIASRNKFHSPNTRFISCFCIQLK